MSALSTPATGEDTAQQRQQRYAAARDEPLLLIGQQARAGIGLQLFELQLQALVLLAQAGELGAFALAIGSLQLDV